MTLPTSIFKFVTLRSPYDDTLSSPLYKINPPTLFVNTITDTLASVASKQDKITSLNTQLQSFLASDKFFKSKAGIIEMVDAAMHPFEGGDIAIDNMTINAPWQDNINLNQAYEVLYDNAVARTITKNTANSIFKTLTDQLKRIHLALHNDQLQAGDLNKLRVVIPEKLVFSFSPPKPTPVPTENTNTAPDEAARMMATFQDLEDQKSAVKKAINANLIQLAVAQKALTEKTLPKIQPLLDESTEKTAARQPAMPGKMPGDTLNGPPETSQEMSTTSPEIENLLAASKVLQEQVESIDSAMGALSLQIIKSLPRQQFVRIGNKWVNNKQLNPGLSTSSSEEAEGVEGEHALIVDSGGHELKFPFQVADLRVVEQQTVGYVPAEIAHIHNTQQGELHERTTRRLKRTETFESLLTESEVFHETDSQSTEKFTLEQTASEVQSEENTMNVNASASGTYGVTKVSVDAGYSNTQSSQNSNSSSQGYAKEIVQKVVDRVSNKVTAERSLKTIEEFEETVRHVIDNTKSTAPKSYVYRWLTKLSKATLKNYGKRLIFQIDIPHPAHYFIANSQKIQSDLKVQTEAIFLELPDDPRTEINPDLISRSNVTLLETIYKVDLGAPPPDQIIVGFKNAGGADATSFAADIAIPSGYKANMAKTSIVVSGINAEENGNVCVIIGNGLVIMCWANAKDPAEVRNFRPLNGETGNLPITIFQPFGNGYQVNVEIECADNGAYKTWQMTCWRAIIAAFDTMKSDAETKMSEWNPDQPGINPLKKNEIIRTELKREALRIMSWRNPFWVDDNYVVGLEYFPDAARDNLNGERIRFLETLFDWQNVMYELHPYFYTGKRNWSSLLNLSDDDPHFEAFLQSSFATVRIPVYRDSLKERAAVNYIMYNAIANYEVLPESTAVLLHELENEPATKFVTYDLSGNEIPGALETVDLGVYPVPTDLVILECGVENGVKPKGFDGLDAYRSPAIISDRCESVEDIKPTGSV